MQVLFKVIRQRLNQAPWVQTYTLDVAPSTTILDCLNQIKWAQDGTLAFRKNCRNTICGSCAMRINGRAALACKENIRQEIQQAPAVGLQPHAEVEDAPAAIPEIVIAPMANMPVIKDLIVDMSGFWQQYRAVDPVIRTAGSPVPEREFLQSPSDRAKLDQVGNCILCGSCYSDCNALEMNPDFVGPHALAKAHRTLADTRDQVTPHRLTQYNQSDTGVWGCTRCLNCNAVCPVGVAPLDQISRIKSQILAQNTAPANRSIRHRKVLVDLVRQGGWIDERQFGLRVVGNGFRDLNGILSLVPLGWRMLRQGKFPDAFEASTGTAEVRSLIDSVKILEKSSAGPMSDSNQPQTTPAPDATTAHPAEATPGFGWTVYAERINGRFAMLGFIGLLLLELITHQDFLTWLGLR